MSLSKPAQNAIFQQFPFRKRLEISQSIAEFRNLNRKLPFRFKFVTICDDAPSSQFELDGAFFWSIAEHPLGALLTFRSEHTQFEKILENYTKNQVLEGLVHFFLKREATEIDELRILNHPCGLETCFPLRIRRVFSWKSLIFSEKSDYSTWFGALRFQRFPVEIVEIDVVNRSDLLIFTEETIIRAPELSIRSHVDVPIQGILKLEALKLRLKTQTLRGDDFLALCQEWSRKPTGSFFELKMSTEELEDQCLPSNLKVSRILSEDVGVRVEVK